MNTDTYSPEGAVWGVLATKTVEKSVSSVNDMMEGGSFVQIRTPLVRFVCSVLLCLSGTGSVLVSKIRTID
jgi:hypothetical protein